MKTASVSIEQRLQALDWASIRDGLWQNGFAVTEPVLTNKECKDLIQMYRDDSRFRSHIIMARYRFGSGDYKYFAHPLPNVIQELREHSYLHLRRSRTSGTTHSGWRNVFQKQHSQLLTLCAQSKAQVISPDQGQILIFTTRYRPVKGTKGFYRANVRHGVSRVNSGVRFTLGVIFHDAK